MSAAEPPAPRIPRPNLVIGLLVGLPASAVFLYLATRGLDAGEVWTALANARPLPAAGAVVAMMLVAVVQAERWRRIASHFGVAPRRVFVALVVAAIAVNNVVPGRPGEVLRGYWLARMIRAPVARAFSTVVVDRAADVLVLVLALGATFPLVEHPPWLRTLALGALVLAAVFATALVLARWYARHSRRGRERARPGAVSRSWLGRQVSGLVRGAAGTLSPRTLASVGALSLLAWAVWTAGAWLAAYSLGITLTPWEALFVATVLNLGTAIPSSPGFVGTYQWLAVAALGLMDVPSADAFAFSVLLHASWFVPTTLAGAGLGLWTGASRRSHSPAMKSLGRDAA